jgi:hypothetical protein
VRLLLLWQERTAWRLLPIGLLFISGRVQITHIRRRFGIQAQLVSADFQKIYRFGEKLFVALPGLGTDVQTVYAKLFYFFS